MTTDAIGTARVDIVADTSGLEVGVNRANNVMRSFSESSQASIQKMNKEQQRVIRSLERQTDVVGLTREQMTAYNIVTRTSGQIQSDLLSKLQKNTAALQAQGNAAAKVGTQFNEYGRSQKQIDAALRQTPAQLTDIFVSLQGGQAPLTVLLQQGGQLKDVFGGVRPAIAALGAELMALVTPVTVVAGAIIAFVAAAYSGSKEAGRLASALAKAGDASGATRDSLIATSEAIDGITGTQGKAVEALEAVAGAGVFTEQQFKDVAIAAIEFERATGQAIEETVAQFAKLAKDPVAAVRELIGKYKEFDLALYDQVRALVAAGQQQEASTLLIERFGEVTRDAAVEIQENAGLITKAWRGVKVIVSEVADSLKRIGSESSRAAQIAELQARNREILQSEGGGRRARLFEDTDANRRSADQIAPLSLDRRGQFFDNLDEIRRLEKEAADKAKEAARIATQQRVEAAIASGDAEVSARQDTQTRLRKQIERETNEYNVLIQQATEAGLATEANRLKALRDANSKALQARLDRAESGRNRPVNTFVAETRDGLGELKAALAEERAEIAASRRVLREEFQGKAIDAADFYTRSRALVEADLRVQEDALTKQIDFLRTRDGNARQNIQTQTEITRLESELAKARAAAAGETARLSVEEAALQRQREASLASLREASAARVGADRDQIQSQIDRIRMGDREYEVQQRLIDLERERAEKLDAISARQRNGQLDSDQAREETRIVEAEFTQRVKIMERGYAQIRAAQEDWRNGVRSALENWKDNARDYAGQVSSILTNSLDGATDALVNFATTGKSQWRSLLADIGQQLVRFFAQKAVLQFLEAFGGDTSKSGSASKSGKSGSASKGGGGGGVFASFFSDLLGSFFGFAKGGTPTLGDYRNGVYDSPQTFKFAKGTGVFGEAGAEAIMPLARDGAGNLGVRAQGGGNTNNVNVVVQTNVTSDGASSSAQSSGDQGQAYAEFAQQMRNVAQEEVQKSLRQGGTLWKAGVR